MVTTRDEAFQEYREALARIDQQVQEVKEARERARTTLHEQLKALRDAAHEELKAIRILEQKTKRSK